jgi:hypothetical protein
MLRRVFTYGVISRTLGGVLVLAAALKVHEFLTLDYDQISVAILIAALAEAFLGTWLLFGFFPFWSRFVLLLVFVVFMEVSLSRAVSAEPCGCLGRVDVSPWIVFGIDLAVAAALLFLPRADSSSAASPKRWAGFAAVCSGIVACCAVAAAARLFTWGNAEDPSSPAAHHLVTQVCEGITANNNGYQTLELSLSQITERAGAKEQQRILKDKKGQVVAIVFESPRFYDEYRVLIRGPDVRWETTAGTAAGGIQTIFGGCALSYSPMTKRAVAREAESAGGDLDFPDPRCLGFAPPLLSVPDWIRRQKVAQVAPYEQGEDQGIEIRFEMRKAGPNLPYVDGDWTVRFARAYSYLPVSSSALHLNGRQFLKTRFTYQRLPDESAWILKKLVTEFWPTDAPPGQAPDAEKPRLVNTYGLLGEPKVNQKMEDSAFDIAVPKGTSVSLATKKMSYANVPNANTFFDLFDKPESEAASLRRKSWPYVIGVSLTLFCGLLLLRKFWKL